MILTQATASLVVSIFEMENRLGYYVPRINFRFEEADTGHSWIITAGGTRCYVVRCGRFEKLDWEDQAADSHFMVSRVVSALVISGAGLFSPQVKGRVILHDIEHQEWDSQITADVRWSDEVKRVHRSFSVENFGGWLRAISSHTFLRRAIDDMVLALRFPTEAFIFLYRGFEWLEDGLHISTKEMATAIGVKINDLKQLGKIANNETGVRHASKSGAKTRADLETYSTWTAGLADGINFARSKLDTTFTRMTSTEIAEALRIAVLIHPYP